MNFVTIVGVVVVVVLQLWMLLDWVLAAAWRGYGGHGDNELI